jgi:hypothetical protein
MFLFWKKDYKFRLYNNIWIFYFQISNEQDVEGFDAGFVILKKQLKNTILTSDLIKTLKAVYTSKEWSEIMDTQVVSAIFYKKSDFIESNLEWFRTTTIKFGLLSKSVPNSAFIFLELIFY